MSNIYLNLNSSPWFENSAFRRFDKHEKHITRTFFYDVLLLVFDGVLRFYEDGKLIELTKGQYYIQRAGLFQEGKLPSSSPYYYFVHFNGEFTESPVNSLPISGTFDMDKMMHYIKKLHDAEHSHKSTLIAKTGLFYTLLDKLSTPYISPQNENSVEHRLYEYLSTHFTEQVKIKDISKEFSYSEDHIIRAFRKTYGVTPHKHLTDLRIQYAKELLTTTDRPIQRIAEDCGYTDISVFYKCFFKAVGATPIDYKKHKITAVP